MTIIYIPIPKHKNYLTNNEKATNEEFVGAKVKVNGLFIARIRPFFSKTKMTSRQCEYFLLFYQRHIYICTVGYIC